MVLILPVLVRKIRPQFWFMRSCQESRHCVKQSFTLFLRGNTTKKLINPFVKYCVCGFIFLGGRDAQTVKRPLGPGIKVTTVKTVIVLQKTIGLKIPSQTKNAELKLVSEKLHFYSWSWSTITAFFFLGTSTSIISKKAGRVDDATTGPKLDGNGTG